jgi:hypothetical protein
MRKSANTAKLFKLWVKLEPCPDICIQIILQRSPKPFKVLYNFKRKMVNSNKVHWILSLWFLFTCFPVNVFSCINSLILNKPTRPLYWVCDYKVIMLSLLTQKLAITTDTASSNDVFIDELVVSNSTSH